MSDTQPKLAIRTASKALSTQYDVMFDRQIDHANEWQEEMYVLRQAGESDVCNIHINTCGGAVSTISAFQNIKKSSEAHFHGILEGIGYSAGSAFFLMCDTHEVGDFAEMMIHTSQGGFGGSSQGQEASGAQMARSARKLVTVVYKDFLTDDEMEDVLKGMEIWLDSDQIRERLLNRETIRHQREVDAAKEEYTPEVYASQILEDISEDCETFGYSVDEILSLVKGMLSVVEEEEQLPDVEEEFPANLNALEEVHSSGYMIGGSHIDIDHCDRGLLKFSANTLGIKFAHNLHTEKLRKRILDFLEK
ncbi:ClpP/crotonase-like domain protein [Vibrio phage 1.063.O._10N.261.45.C7]|nr:ClpP/crotonase-like domain protein [Vibrio phage 1.063.O._10N.261.45.C7]